MGMFSCCSNDDTKKDPKKDTNKPEDAKKADAKKADAKKADAKGAQVEEKKTASERKTAWEEIRKELPRKKTPEDKQRRIELFKKFDEDDSGSLTLAETQKGCIDILHLDRFTTRTKDITKRAYAKASNLGNQIEGVGDEDLVEFREFRLMLCYIYDYFELTVMFDEIDTSGNMMLDKDEFKQAVPKLKEWGVDIKDPEATFKEIDDNNSGQLTFDEFAAWASAAKLDADGDPDNDPNGPKSRAAPAPTEEKTTASERKTAWEEIRKELPRKKTPEDKKRRIELFKKFDEDDSGSLTLAETQKGCIDILRLDRFTTRTKDITKRAYAKASNLGNQIEGVGDEDLVEFREFRLMLCYIYDYFELTVMFDEIDTSGNMMLDKDEFKQAVPKLKEWGVDIKDPEATFKEIDDNNSGQLTFDEFAAWASAAKLDADGDPDNTK